MTAISVADVEVMKVFEVEQDIASIMKFVLNHAENPAPYYWEVPSHFIVPSVYFPMPEIDTDSETFRTYNMDYTWYIKIFHHTSKGAYDLGLAVITAIRAARNLVPLIAEDGSEIEGSWVRLNDPKLTMLDGGAAQLAITWRRRMPYNDAAVEAQRSQAFHADVFIKPEKEISDADAEELEQYITP